MKNILLLGDIHANYPALKAVWHTVRSKRFDSILNTGDFTVYGPFPNETIQWFRKRKNIIAVLGNTDRRILNILEGKRLKRPRKEEKRVMYFWTSENLLPENVAYLKSLPQEADVTIGRIRIGLFHGTMEDEDETLFPSDMGRRFHQLAKESPFRIHIMGHSHIPYYKIVDGVHFINPGSVGRMFDGDPRASFAILSLSSEKIAVELFRIAYPVKEVIQGLRQHHLPDIYEAMFMKGKKSN